MRLFVGFQAAADFKPVHVMHHDIQENNIGERMGDQLKDFLPALPDEQFKPDMFQQADQNVNII